MRLIDFARLVKPGYEPDWYHSLIAEYLEAATSGDPAVPNVLISCPPGHGKTELTAVLLPAWLLAHDRSRQLISLAAGDSLAAISSRAVRSILRSPIFADTFGPVDFDKESESEWQLLGQDRPTMYSAGVGGSITGRRADVLVFDDLIKSMSDAFSPTVRDKTFETYRDCGESRLSPAGVVVGMGTRWHSLDPHGALLRRAAEDSRAKQFIYLSLAATNDSGTDSFVLDTRSGEPIYLPPYRSLARLTGHRYSFARPALDSRRADLGPTRWAALYQQSPLAGESQLFPADAWPYLETPPAPEDVVALVSSWDCASKQGLANDYSANVVIAELRSGHLAVLDVYRAKMTFDKLLETVVTRHTLLQRQFSLPALTVVEDAGAGQELIPVLSRLNIPLLAARAVHSKFVRAEGITHLTRSGAVLLPRHAAWLAMFLKELAEFPAGTHDDIVDATVHGLKVWADSTDFKAPDPLALAVGSYTRPDPEAAEIEEMLLRASTSFAPDLDAIDGNYPALREIGGDEW